VPIISTTTAIEIQSQEDPFLAVTAGIAAAASGVLVVSEGASSVAESLAASATGVQMERRQRVSLKVSDDLLEFGFGERRLPLAPRQSPGVQLRRI